MVFQDKKNIMAINYYIKERLKLTLYQNSLSNGSWFTLGLDKNYLYFYRKSEEKILKIHRDFTHPISEYDVTFQINSHKIKRLTIQ